MREIIVILDNIRSALNVGAILRTCDGAGISQVYLCGVTPDITHAKIAKTALGAEFKIKTMHFKSSLDAINKVKELGFEVLAIELTNSAVQINKATFKEKTALVFGHEATGLLPDTLNACDKHVMLPMLGSKNSLNVATTVGIVTYYIRLNEL